MKKYAVSINTFEVEPCGADYFSTALISNPEAIESVNVPPNMICNRVTFQVANDAVQSSGSFFLVNTRPPMDVNDGARVVPGWYDVATKLSGDGRYTFENFNGEEISNTFYMANISLTGGRIITVIFEGYQR